MFLRALELLRRRGKMHKVVLQLVNGTCRFGFIGAGKRTMNDEEKRVTHARRIHTGGVNQPLLHIVLRTHVPNLLHHRGDSRRVRARMWGGVGDGEHGARCGALDIQRLLTVLRRLHRVGVHNVSGARKCPIRAGDFLHNGVDVNITRHDQSRVIRHVEMFSKRGHLLRLRVEDILARSNRIYTVKGFV